MKRSTIVAPLLILAFLCMFSACKKEFSIENGGFSGTAQGELVDSLGNCKSSVISGTYSVDTPLVTTTNYASINVNFTSQGKYKIFTDTVNGMWFLDSGFAVSTGAAVIKLKGYGKPILPKTTTFTIYFNNNVCSFNVSVNGSTTGGGSGGGGGTGNSGTGTNGDYFPTTSGSTWTYQYIPKLGNIDTFKVSVPVGLYTIDSLSYARFGTSLLDTFYFAKDGKGTYYAYSTPDFDYTFIFDTIPTYFMAYPFLKESANVADTWETPTYGPVWTNATKGMSKAVFTIMSKNAPYTVGGKAYSNVITVKRDVMFQPNGSTTWQTLLSGNSYYAKDYGLIDQVFATSPSQSVSIVRTPTIR